MIRNNFDVSDDEFHAIVEPFDKEIKKYIKENILYDYLAFYLATGYNLDALWEGILVAHLNSAIDDLCAIHFRNDFDYSLVNKILKEKYNLEIINDTPLEIQSIKKQDQHSSWSFSYGIKSFCPTWIKLGFEMLFAFAISGYRLPLP